MVSFLEYVVSCVKVAIMEKDTLLCVITLESVWPWTKAERGIFMSFEGAGNCVLFSLPATPACEPVGSFLSAILRTSRAGSSSRMVNCITSSSSAPWAA